MTDMGTDGGKLAVNDTYREGTGGFVSEPSVKELGLLRRAVRFMSDNASLSFGERGALAVLSDKLAERLRQRGGTV